MGAVIAVLADSVAAKRSWQKTGATSMNSMRVSRMGQGREVGKIGRRDERMLFQRMHLCIMVMNMPSNDDVRETYRLLLGNDCSEGYICRCNWGRRVSQCLDQEGQTCRTARHGIRSNKHEDKLQRLRLRTCRPTTRGQRRLMMTENT